MHLPPRPRRHRPRLGGRRVLDALRGRQVGVSHRADHTRHPQRRHAHDRMVRHQRPVHRQHQGRQGPDPRVHRVHPRTHQRTGGLGRRRESRRDWRLQPRRSHRAANRATIQGPTRGRRGDVHVPRAEGRLPGRHVAKREGLTGVPRARNRGPGAAVPIRRSFARAHDGKARDDGGELSDVPRDGTQRVPGGAAAARELHRERAGENGCVIRMGSTC